MFGTDLVQRLVQSVALSHLIMHRDRAGLLLLAAPESGKTTIACAATASHVHAVTLITGKSVLSTIGQKDTEFLLFNDMASIRALSRQASAMLIVILNQIINGEKGVASFAGTTNFIIDRPIGIIGCLPFKAFTDKRAQWRDLGFVSRLIPFAYSYNAELIATIKDSLDVLVPPRPRPRPMPRKAVKPVDIKMTPGQSRHVRALADARAIVLGQIGIRMLKNYHVVIRAHALLHGRRTVTDEDLDFLRAIDAYVSITECRPL